MSLIYKKLGEIYTQYILIVVMSFIGISAAVYAAEPVQTLSLEEAVYLSQSNDPWLVSNQFQQDAIKSESIAAGTLPDPKISVGLANLSINTFDFGQEAMTQLKIGVTQMFPRGDSLSLRQQQLELTAEQYPFLRQDRRAKLSVTTAQIWFDIYKTQESIALIERNRNLFEQLSDVAKAGYSSALGKSNQQDIIRAQLEVTRLEDKLTVLAQEENMLKQKLSEWVGKAFVGEYRREYEQDYELSFSTFTVPNTLPQIKLINSNLYLDEEKSPNYQQSLYEAFSDHPLLLALEQRIESSRKGVELTKQLYKPEWGLNAGYSYRGDDPMGNSRDDLLSIGVSFDLPIFTSSKQDKQVQAAISQSESIKTEKWLLLRNMMASYGTAKAQFLKLEQRQKLYNDFLLPQMQDQADASLTAYTNDKGDFAEVVRSLIAQLNTQLDALAINVDLQKLKVQLNYFFTPNVDSVSISHKSYVDGEVK
ncbi:TolC family protein [Shewanella phaeophyticola]|uniref:TolC family protein n=1 Tax=Shewanella phaeophyticola TaxID=2978345 RepID=A0ABT2P6I4_9GAMM|nr:TolC family protein [Shewanella sp. KJ10-1]MCT8988087.1 TolC family protein [Shewanella sp. KJ10-1]